MTGGTGQKFEAAATVTAGVASLAATLLSIVYERCCPVVQLVQPGLRSLPRHSPLQVLTRPVRTGRYGSRRKAERYLDARADALRRSRLLTLTPQQKLPETAAAAICRPHPAHVRAVRLTRRLRSRELS